MRVCYSEKGCFADFKIQVNLARKMSRDSPKARIFMTLAFQDLPVRCKSANNCIQQDKNSSQTTP